MAQIYLHLNVDTTRFYGGSRDEKRKSYAVLSISWATNVLTIMNQVPLLQLQRFMFASHSMVQS